MIDSGGKLLARLYDKHDDFDLHTVNFPFLSSNIPFGLSRCYLHYDDFRYHPRGLVDRLLSRGYKVLWLEKLFKKFYGSYQDLS